MKKKIQKKKPSKKIDVTEAITGIHEQLAVLDRKLDSFMTKSLTELAAALSAQKQAAQPRPVPPAPVSRSYEPPRRTMYAVICYECGKDCEIPFKPTGDRPVYCPECFAKRKAARAAARMGGDSKPSGAPSFSTRAPAPSVEAKKPVVKKPAARKPAARKKSAAKKKPAVKKKAAKKK